MPKGTRKIYMRFDRDLSDELAEQKMMDSKIKGFCSVDYKKAHMNAKVPFIHHQMITCDCRGLQHTIKGHDITLRVPERALPEGTEIHLEVAVAMYGPFKFSENVEPISPILWLCVLEENIVLNKPIVVRIPHALTQASSDRIKYHKELISFAKADHNVKVIDQKCGQKYYQFMKIMDGEEEFQSTKGYGVLQISHCCFICIERNKQLTNIEDIRYSLARVRLSPVNINAVTVIHEFQFFGMYDLPTCAKALEMQLEKNGLDVPIQYSEFSFEEVKYQPECRHPFIRIVVPSDQTQFTTALDPLNGEIKASAINFWGKYDLERMKDHHERNMYPPRVKLEVILKGHNPVVFRFGFQGCTKDSNLESEIALRPVQSVTSISSSESRLMLKIFSNVDNTVTLELRNIFRLLFPLAPHWHNIGILLGIDQSQCFTIRANESDVHSRLREMLSLWLKRSSPKPTWEELSDAVQSFDPTISIKCRNFGK